MAMVAYLCSPNPHVIKHSKDHNNLNPDVHLMVNSVIEWLILPRREHTAETRKEALLNLIEKFWKERDEFVHKTGYFAREHIWVAAEREDSVAH